MKNSKKGISLIVLIITIIVIIILATAILVSVINNNPISEANKARYESDRDNMQAVFTNTVGKIMAENQGVVNVTAGQINTETTGVNEATGEVTYTVDNATVAANSSGTIKFDKGTNDATTYYTGKKLPIYAAGETKWYVDTEGVLTLEVAGVKYGSGEVEKMTYTSLGNWKHQLSDGTIESHDTESGICSKCSENVLAPGVYDENDVMIASWDELVNDYGLDITVDGGPYHSSMQPETSLSKILTNDKFTNAIKLVINDDVEYIGGSQLSCSSLQYVFIPESVTELGANLFYSATKITSVEIPSSVTSFSNTFSYNSSIITVKLSDGITNISTGAFSYCVNLTSVEIPNSVTSIGGGAFNNCQKLTSIYIPKSVTTITANILGSGSVSEFAPFNSCSPDLKIYTEVNEVEIPSGWGKYWNYYTSGKTLDVTYGVTREEYEAIIAQ